MNRVVVGIIIIIFLLIGGFFALNTFIYNAKQGGTTMDISNNTKTENKKMSQIIPISHATMILNLGGEVIYNDPVGGTEKLKGQPEANMILISDIHGDHLDVDTLRTLSTERTLIIAPQAVIDLLPDNLPGTIVVLANGEKTTQRGIEIEAIPMYNVPESSDARHTKGRGNGYVLSVSGQRIYIAGDTSVTPEMRSLKSIDVAFIPMNLPFTMGVDEAAEGVLAFKPKVVHPYHYRGQDGLADVTRFKELVEASNAEIKVELFNFYPEE